MAEGRQGRLIALIALIAPEEFKAWRLHVGRQDRLNTRL